MPKKKIMVVDDDPPTIDFLKKLLELQGFELICAYSGKECLELLRKEIPDIMLLDLMMPEMDGYDVLAELKDSEKYKDIPVIVVTAKDEYVEKAPSLGHSMVKAFVAKPFAIQILIDKIKKVVGD